MCLLVEMNELPCARKVSAAVSVGARRTRSPAARRARSTCNWAAAHSLPSPADHSRARRQCRRRASCSTAAARARGSLHVAGSGRCSARAAGDTPLHTVAADLPTTTTPPPAPRVLRARRVTIVFQSPPQVSTTRYFVIYKRFFLKTGSHLVFRITITFVIKKTIWMRNVRKTRSGCDVAFETVLGKEVRVHDPTGGLRHEEEGRGGGAERDEGEGGDGQQQVAHGHGPAMPRAPRAHTRLTPVALISPSITDPLN